MPALGQHIILRLRDNRVLARDLLAQRMLARVVLGRSRSLGLVAFRGADTHMHLLSMLDRASAGQSVRHLESSLAHQMGRSSHFSPAYFQAIRSQRHLRNTFFYLLRQEGHHGFAHDPFSEVSNFQDFLGMRVLGRSTVLMMRRVLPRIREHHVLDELGWGAVQPALPMLDGLVAAAAAAFGIVDLGGRSSAVVAARRSAVHFAKPGFSVQRIAHALQLSDRCVRRHVSIAVPLTWTQAVAWQMGLRSKQAHIVTAPA